MDSLRFIVAAPILTILPGAWVTFGLPFNQMSWLTRLAVGVALSPAVLGVQLVLLKLLGANFAQASLFIFWFNLLSIFLVIRGHLRLPRLRIDRSVVLPVFLLLVFLLTLMLPWIRIPNYRLFSWHALMHTDIIYKLTQPAVFPEEPEIAGLHLAYAWLGHSYWAVLGWLADWSPTRIYPISNVIWLVTAFFLAFQVAKKGFGVSAPAAMFSVGLMFMGSQMVAFSARLLVHDKWRWAEYFGYRVGPLLEKYRGFETMPFALALLLALLLVVMLSLRQTLKYFQVLIAGLLVALALVYTVLLPVGCILVGLQMLLLLTGWSPGMARYSKKRLFLFGFAVGMSILVSLVAYRMYTQDTTGSLSLVSSGRTARSIQAVTPLLFFLVLALPAVIQGFRRRDGATLLLALTALCLMGLSVMMDLGGNEYKFVYVAPIWLAPLCAVSVNDWFVRSPRVGWTLAVAVPLILVAIDLLWILHLGGFVPDSLANAPSVAEPHFWLELSPDEEDAPWINSIRDGTPADTVVLTSNSNIHVGPFIRRSLFAPGDREGESTAGYNLSIRDNLAEMRHYPEQILDGRQNASEEVFSGTVTSRMAEAITELQALHRPVAIHYSNNATASLVWLQRNGLGSQLFSDGRNTVWLMDRLDATNSR